VINAGSWIGFCIESSGALEGTFQQYIVDSKNVTAILVEV
jgi:hypothetical protein